MVAVPKLEVLQEVVPRVLWGCKRQYVIIMDCVDNTRSHIWTTCMDIAYTHLHVHISPPTPTVMGAMSQYSGKSGASHTFSFYMYFHNT